MTIENLKMEFSADSNTLVEWTNRLYVKLNTGEDPVTQMVHN